MAQVSHWQRIKNGDEKAFRTVFYDNYSSLVHFAMRFLGDQAAAEDVVQDVFAKIWDGRSRLEDVHAVEAYLRQSVRNTSLNYLRKQRRLSFTENQLDDVDQTSSIVDQLAGAELEERFKQALTTLPEGCRTIFLLKRMDGLSLKEIASKLAISTKTVENQITKARKLLAIQLQDYLKIVVLFLLTNWLTYIGELAASGVTIMIFR